MRSTLKCDAMLLGALTWIRQVIFLVLLLGFLAAPPGARGSVIARSSNIPNLPHFSRRWSTLLYGWAQGPVESAVVGVTGDGAFEAATIETLEVNVTALLAAQDVLANGTIRSNFTGVAGCVHSYLYTAHPPYDNGTGAWYSAWRAGAAEFQNQTKNQFGSNATTKAQRMLNAINGRPGSALAASCNLTSSRNLYGLTAGNSPVLAFLDDGYIVGVLPTVPPGFSPLSAVVGTELPPQVRFGVQFAKYYRNGPNTKVFWNSSMWFQHCEQLIYSPAA